MTPTPGRIQRLPKMSHNGKWVKVLWGLKILTDKLTFNFPVSCVLLLGFSDIRRVAFSPFFREGRGGFFIFCMENNKLFIFLLAYLN